MSTSTLGLNASTVRSSVPYLSASLGLLGLLTGLYTCVNPREGAKGFGLTLSTSADAKSNTVTPMEQALCRIYGIRNVATGLSTLTLSYLAISDWSRNSVEVADTIRKVLGVGFMFGSIVGFTDGWVLNQISQSSEMSSEAVELAEKSSKGHATLAVPIFGLGLAAWLA